MEIELIKELISSFSKEGLTTLSLKSEEFELKLEKKAVEVTAPLVAPMQAQLMSSVPLTDENTLDTITPSKEEVPKYITSPMVGSFYAATSPTAKPFVEIGSTVKKGDIVCIIEAMKLMNEVEADEEGEVIAILTKDEEMVEYGQPLFMLR